MTDSKRDSQAKLSPRVGHKNMANAAALRYMASMTAVSMLLAMVQACCITSESDMSIHEGVSRRSGRLILGLPRRARQRVSQELAVRALVWRCHEDLGR